MVLEAERNGCLREVLIIASALSIQDPRERPRGQAAAADQHHARFADPTSDFLAFVNLWRYVRDQQHELSSSQFRRMCRREHLNFLRIREWQDVHSQLRRVASDLGMRQNRKRGRAGSDPPFAAARVSSPTSARRTATRREYLGARNARFADLPGIRVWPRSRRPGSWPPSWSRPAGSGAAPRPASSRSGPRRWPAISSSAATASRTGRPSERRRWSTSGSRSTGCRSSTDRLVGYARVDPGACRELFLRHALVEGDWNTPHRIHQGEPGAARRGGGARAPFPPPRPRQSTPTRSSASTRARPAHVVSGRHFDVVVEEGSAHAARSPDVHDRRLLGRLGNRPDRVGLPGRVAPERARARAELRLRAGQRGRRCRGAHPDRVLNQVQPDGFDWQVPGLREELVVELIRSLPKALRRNLVPVPETARAFLGRVEPMSRAAARRARAGADPYRQVSRSARSVWDLARLPPHLRFTFLVVDDERSGARRGQGSRGDQGRPLRCRCGGAIVDAAARLRAPRPHRVELRHDPATSSNARMPGRRSRDTRPSSTRATA